MSKTMNWVLVGACSLTLAAAALAQLKQKPGLWEVTATMSMAGMPEMPQGARNMPNSPFGAHTSQVCVTQAMIDKYGGPNPNPPHADCKVSDVVNKPNGMSAKISCTGQMVATGTVESTWTDPNNTHTTMHLTGNMQMGQMQHPVDMTMKADSVYKGADCGSVKPMPLPPQ